MIYSTKILISLGTSSGRLAPNKRSLYNDPNYIKLLSGFGQNLLIPTGSRASKRSKSDMPACLIPRQLRAIPHNAILQQFGIPANIFYRYWEGCLYRY